MKKQKRYRSEEEIIAHIDKRTKAAHMKIVRAEELREAGRTIIRNEPDSSEYGKRLVEKADKMQRGATRVLEKEIPKLSDALARFRTMTLPGIVPDDSVVL